MSNEIPDFTETSSWKQPSRHEILISDDRAVMPERTFNSLYEYSHSYPTGAYYGKMWKAQMENGDWYLRWYGVVPDNDKLCSNNQRLIRIMDWKRLMGIEG